MHVQWNPYYKEVPGIRMNVFPVTKVTVNCIGQDPNITIFNITILSVHSHNLSKTLKLKQQHYRNQVISNVSDNLQPSKLRPF